MSSLCRGRIVWVEISDPQGRNPKCRPAVVVTATEDIAPEGEVIVVGISTQVDMAPADECVELPWDRNRHPRTGLKERSAAVCTWIKRAQVTSIKDLAGVVPGKQLLKILEKIGDLPIC
jgi:hypothetical protein